MIAAAIPFRRVFAHPSGDTFTMPPVRDWVKGYIAASTVSVDPFARNNRWATHTNDLNPNTAADHHMDARDFLRMFRDESCVMADLVLFDPPYSPRQVKECYDGIGIKCDQKATQTARLRKECRNLICDILAPDGIVLSFGWSTVGMGKRFSILEIMTVYHGGGHNDTICMAERRLPDRQRRLMETQHGCRLP